MILDAGASKPKRANKCSVCKQAGHNKNSSLCLGRPSAVGSATIHVASQDIAALDETPSDEEDNEDDNRLDVVNDI